MTTVENWESSFAIDNSSLKKRKRQKARLPVIQRLSFSVGNFLNDAVAGAWASYLIIFQTKVLGMSNRGVGILSIVAFLVDAVVSLFVGYVCDNVKFPFCAERYGKRKSFHLLGTILVAGFFPLLMMPCFICGSDSSEWKMLVYYGIIMITHNIGWALAQITHLALIPETAKRPREMVELHALRSGITFVSGIFTYVVTWILLKTDDRDESISASNSRDFMEMVIIVVSTGCLFSIIFHLGTKEPPAMMRNKKEEFFGKERQGNPIEELPLPEKVVGVFCLYNDNEYRAALPKAYNTELLDSSLEEQKVTPEDTVVVNKALDNSADISLKNSGTGSQFVDEEKSEFSFSNPGFKTADELFSCGEKCPDEQIAVSEFCTKRSGTEKFTFSNLAFTCEDKQGGEDDTSRSYENSTIADPQNDILVEDRQSNRLDSDISEGYASSPETDSVASTEMQELEDYTKEPAIQVGLRPAPFQPSRKSSFAKGTDTSFAGVDEIIIVDNANKHDKTIWKSSKSWIDWFKNPMFYQVAFASTCSRLIQIYSPSYAPMYLMDTLGFEKESIAYFPLVILISGVFSSLGAKKLDKILGAKWTYCLAASAVIGSSAWFYFQTPSGRNAAYFAAILMGFGGSVMYVTSTALAGELIGESKESGAFVFASMGSLGKFACGGAFFFTQEFFPTNGSTSEYVRYVFSVVPGAASILAFLVVIAFLPATVRCRKVVRTTDAIVQTEDINMSDIVIHNQMVLCDECQKKETVIDITSSKARVVS